ncbi:CHAT domain-containing protein [Streptomyces sp. F001]|uniref:CHAT domain-containing protein n=1 Tax=Streptomyces sp. F001 TaxID=1510026 RepID=UPI0019D05683
MGRPAHNSSGCLVLHDGTELRVTEVSRLDLNADLAFLSACSTARGGYVVPDEAITVASAFLLAGYRNVVGTLWPLYGERLAVAPPWDDQQELQEFGQTDRNERRTSFGVRVQDRTFLTTFAAEEEGAPGAVAGESLQRRARGEVDILDMVASVQVEITRPSEETGGFVLLANGSDQRFHARDLTPAR